MRSHSIYPFNAIYVKRTSLLSADLNKPVASLLDGGLELYNLREDIGEKQNRVQESPDKAKELYQRLVSWRKTFQAPIPTRLNPEYDRLYDTRLRRSQVSE